MVLFQRTYDPSATTMQSPRISSIRTYALSLELAALANMPYGVTVGQRQLIATELN